MPAPEPVLGREKLLADGLVEGMHDDFLAACRRASHESVASSSLFGKEIAVPLLIFVQERSQVFWKWDFQSCCAVLG